jgi:peptidoglycan/xylan/chitin deacetylase (PgdA/CDA1 family)
MAETRKARLPREDRLVLCYHAVSPTWPIGLAVTPGALERQVGVLLNAGYAPATFWEIVHEPPARRAFAVTFDDGWVSVLRHGFPILQRLGVPATVFVASSLVDTHEEPLRGTVIDPWQDTPHRDELYCLSWEELRSLVAQGWEIGAHSMTHPLLTELDDDTLAQELRGSKLRCEEMLGVPCRTMAYPTGDFDERVERATGAAGYEAAAALPKQFTDPRPLAWPRVSIQRRDSDRAFRTKVSPLVRSLRQTAVWPILNEVRVRARGPRPVQS